MQEQLLQNKENKHENNKQADKNKNKVTRVKLRLMTSDIILWILIQKDWTFGHKTKVRRMVATEDWVYIM